MSTYTPGSTATRDRARLYLGDTDVDGVPLFTDLEWDDIIAVNVGTDASVAAAAEIMSNRTAPKMDFSADGSSFKASQQHTHWVKMARNWKIKAGGVAVLFPTKLDGYSDDVGSQEVNETRD